MWTCARAAVCAGALALTVQWWQLAAGRVLLGHRQGVSIFDTRGTLVRSVTVVEPSSFLVEGTGRVVAARGGVVGAGELVAEGRQGRGVHGLAEGRAEPPASHRDEPA